MKIAHCIPGLGERARADLKLPRPLLPRSSPVNSFIAPGWVLGEPEPAVTSGWSELLWRRMPESEGDPSDSGGSPRLGMLKLRVSLVREDV